MVRFWAWAWLIGVVLVAPGCVSSAVKDQAQKTAVAHDQYDVLIRSTLDGSIRPSDGKPVTAAEFAATPASVRELLTNALRALYVSRRGWHQLAFALDVGVDPTTLQLDPPELPK